MAKKQEDRFVTLDNGEVAKATFPIVVSASRSTDIPAFYADWFFHRLKKVILLGLIHLMELKAMSGMMTPNLSFFGLRILVHF